MAQQRGAETLSRRRRVRPVFVVTPARSGSTLLRYLLDSHPEIVAPPELNLSDLLQHLVSVWTNLNAAADAPPENGASPATIAPDVAKRARKAIDEIMVTAANEAGASVFCDKSLTTVDHLSTISQCYPTSKLIFLYRYPLDMIASGLEASRWGFNAFGFLPFMAASPGNLVAALGNYWIDRTTKMVTFERTCELGHARLYYELLCDDPKGTLEQLFEFLELPPDDGVIERMFERRHGVGPGDYKIDFSGRIAVDSIGRGATLPEHMGEDQVARIDELLAELDYPDLASGRRGDLAALLGLKRHGAGDPPSRSIAAELIRRLGARPHDSVPPQHLGALPMRVAIRDAHGVRTVVLIGKNGQGEMLERDEANGSIPAVRCIGDVLLRAADGEITFARAVHENLIRVELDHGPAEDRPERPHLLLAALAALIRDDGE
jgi:hypothetical protein